MHQLSLFNPSGLEPTEKESSKIQPEEIFEAYFSCRHNKRNTANALTFEIDYESKLIELCAEINKGAYEIGRSWCLRSAIRSVFFVHGTG